MDTTFSLETTPPVIPHTEYNRIAVVPVRTDGFDETEALYYTDAIENWFVGIGDYTVVSRSNVNRVISEQDLRYTGRYDNSSLASIGRLLGADAIVVTTLYRSSSSYFWSIKVINTENGVVLWGTDGEDKFSDVFPGVLEPLLGGSTRTMHVTESVEPIVQTGRVRRVVGYQDVEVNDPTRTTQAILAISGLGVLLIALAVGGGE